MRAGNFLACLIISSSFMFSLISDLNLMCLAYPLDIQQKIPSIICPSLEKHTLARHRHPMMADEYLPSFNYSLF